MINNTKKPKKIADINKPSTFPPSPNSRSIIISHGSIVNDDTIKNNQEDSNTNGLDLMSLASRQKVIEPLIVTSINQDKVKKRPKTEEDKLLKPASALEKKPEIDNKDKINESEARASKSYPEDKSPTDTKVAIDNNTKSEEEQKQLLLEQEAKELIEHETSISKLIEDRTYYLELNKELRKHNNKQFIIIGIIVCLLLALVWLDIALDSGIISNNFNLPHTNFFGLIN